MFVAEALTPLILESQKQFNFTHVLAGAGAFGKVTETHYTLYSYIVCIRFFPQALPVWREPGNHLMTTYTAGNYTVVYISLAEFNPKSSGQVGCGCNL